MKKLHDVKVGFYGTPDFSLHFLKYLFTNGAKISFVVSQPPRKSGRGKKEKLSPVREWAKNKILRYLHLLIAEMRFLKKFLKKCRYQRCCSLWKHFNEKINKSSKFSEH